MAPPWGARACLRSVWTQRWATQKPGDDLVSLPGFELPSWDRTRTLLIQSRAGEFRRELGQCKVAEVTRTQVSKLHLEMKERPYMANRALAALSALFTYTERHGHRVPGANPCVGIDEYREEKRERYLKEPELAAINAALEKGLQEGLPLPARRKRSRATEATTKHQAKDAGRPVPLI